MSSKGPPKPPDDEVTAQLRAAVRNRRPLSIARVLVTLGLVLAPIIAFVWFYQPQPRAVQLVAITFDALAIKGQEAELIAQVFPADAEDADARLDGRDLIFEAASPLEVEAKRASSKTNAKGLARMSWSASEKIGEFLVRWPEGRIADQARIFSLPASTPLILVDVETTLTHVQPEAWKSENILDIPAVADARKALRALADKGREIVYLALGSGEPYVHRKVRGWMENRFAEGWPVGPVLARRSYDAASEFAKEYEQVLASLRKTFSGSISFVVAHKELAKTAVDLKMTTFLLGDEEPPPGCIAVRDWPALADHFAKKP